MVQYKIHDNGGRPFLVHITGKKAIVYEQDLEYDDCLEYKDKPVLSFSYVKIFVGKPSGNSLLFLTGKNTYIHVGCEIYQFKTKLPIVKFESPIGNSDIPYPYAITSKIPGSGPNTYVVYLLLEKVGMLTEDKVQFNDPYRIYYDRNRSKNPNSRKWLQNNTKKMQTKTIRKRIAW